MFFRSLIYVMLVCAAMLVRADEPSEKLAEVERLYQQYSEQLNVPDIEAVEALALTGRLLVDVRTEAERALSMLPGAIDQKAYEVLPKAERQNAIIYCTIGVRSGEYVAALAKEGIEASNLAGGLLAWTHAGGAMLHKGQAVDEAHVYGRRWNLLPKPYKAEWFWWVL